MWRRFWALVLIFASAAACGGGGRVEALLELTLPASDGQDVVVCCTGDALPLEIGRVEVRNLKGETVCFWVALVDGPLRFALYSAGNEPSAGAAFDPAEELVPGVQQVTGIGWHAVLVVYARSCNWAEASFQLRAIESSAKIGLLSEPSRTPVKFVNSCESPDPAPDPEVVFQAEVPEAMTLQTSLITRTGPGNSTDAAGVLWREAQLAGVQDPELLWHFSEGFRAGVVRRTADRTQAAFLSNDVVLLGPEPEFDPDLAFADDLFHIDLVTGDIRRLTRFRDERRWALGHVWSGDNRSILVNVLDYDALSKSFEIVDVATGTVTRVAGPFPNPTTGLGLTNPAWSPDGTKIAYGLQGRLHMIDLLAGTDTVLVDGANVSGVNWHPTDDLIVYTGGPAIVGVDSAGEQQFSHGATGGNAFEPEWSWDGTRIAFANEFEVAILDVATGEVTSLPETDGPKYHDW